MKYKEIELDPRLLEDIQTLPTKNIEQDDIDIDFLLRTKKPQTKLRLNDLPYEEAVPHLKKQGYNKRIEPFIHNSIHAEVWEQYTTSEDNRVIVKRFYYYDWWFTSKSKLEEYVGKLEAKFNNNQEVSYDMCNLRSRTGHKR